MDLERIKQNLRLRSGRPRKSKKKTIPSASQPPKQETISKSTATIEPPAKQAGKPEASEGDQKEKGRKEPFGGLPNLETDSAPAHRPGLPQASTDLVNGDTKPADLERYGRSGMDKPKRGSARARPPPERAVTDAPRISHSDMSDGDTDFDLRPPAPRPKPPSLEAMSELLFSAGHLNTLLQEPQSVAKFAAFLNKYRPEFQPLILRYLESQKAIKAVEYANAIAEGAATEKDAAAKTPSAAATLDRAFEEASTASFNSLVGTALPMYVTYCLVKLVTECLVNEVTGKQTPMMRNLMGGLSEIFCITDPNQEDNPIIYASEEFYRLTGYETDDVIGRNCRFLQGVKTNRQSPHRLRESIDKGEEHCETLLNYRRDGRPFINLLMIAPLHDDKGKVKYHIGAQVDVSGLVTQGRGLDGFERFLQLRRNNRERRKDNRTTEAKQKSKALQKLQELSEMFDLEESAVVQSHSRASSLSRDEDSRSIGSSQRRQRRVFVDSDRSDEEQDDEEQSKDDDAWKLGLSGPSGPSGKLPGVYDSYMLVKAGASLRIIFVSPKLRKIGNVIRRPLLAHVAAPATTLAGLKESFSTGVPVSAKINFMVEPGKDRDGTKTAPGTKLEDGKYGKTCWISATPLLGSDDRVGVWMVVVVEASKVRRSTRTAGVEARISAKAEANSDSRGADVPGYGSLTEHSNSAAPELSLRELPIKPKRLDDLAENPSNHGPHMSEELRTGGEIDEVRPDESEELVETLQQTIGGNGLPNMDHDFSDNQDDIPDNQQDALDDQQDIPNGERDVSHSTPAEQSSYTVNPHPEERRKYTPPPEIPDSMQNATPPPKTPNVEINDVTPTRMRFDDDEDGDGSPGHRIATRHQPNDMQPMDYLRHPGSGVRQGDIEGDKWTDNDCKSPYSVD